MLGKQHLKEKRKPVFAWFELLIQSFFGLGCPLIARLASKGFSQISVEPNRVKRLLMAGNVATKNQNCLPPKEVNGRRQKVGAPTNQVNF